MKVRSRGTKIKIEGYKRLENSGGQLSCDDTGGKACVKFVIVIGRGYRKF